MNPAVTIEGSEHVPGSPVFVLPNRVDLVALRTLEEALGGMRKIAWLVEDSMRPEPSVMSYLKQREASGIMCSVARTGQEALAEQIRSEMAAGRHVALLPGRPAQPPAALADVPLSFLHYLLDKCPHAVLPVYVGMYRRKQRPFVTTQAPCERVMVRFHAAVNAAPTAADEVMATWLAAQAEQVSKLMQDAEESLSAALLRALCENPHAEIIDGVDDTRMSYRSVLMHAAPLARRLRKQTISKRLGILLPPGKHAVIANVACILSGITPVNIDYTYSETSFRHVAEQAGLTRFITVHPFIRMKPHFPWPRQRDILFIDDALAASGLRFLSLWKLLGRWMTPRRMQAWIRTPQQNPEDEALAVYTPAEEGSPIKKASLSHRAVLAGTALCHSRFGVSEGQRVLSSLPYYYREGLLSGLIHPLLLGQGIITYPIPGAGKRICQLARQYKPAMAVFTPAQAGSALAQAQEGDFDATAHFHVIGRVSPHAARQAFQEKGVCLCECYMPPETAMPVACNTAPSTYMQDGAAHSISGGAPGAAGLILPGVAVRITDIERTSEALPLSSPGLIWVKSAAAATPTDAPSIQDRWRSTGDVGYMREDGLLVVAGPRYRFSKIRGEVVSHADIEQKLLPALRIAPEPGAPPRIAVVGLKDEDTGEELIVLLSTVHRVVGPHDVITIRYALTNAHTPSHWAPQRIVALRAIPTLPGGQVDYAFCRSLARRALGFSS